MTPRQKGLVLAACHLGIVLSLGAKLLIDRATLPRVWVKTQPVDPSEPIRGRYVRLRIGAIAARPAGGAVGNLARLHVENERLVAEPWVGSEGVEVRQWPGDSGAEVLLDEPLAFFIPERTADPSRRAEGEELWVEVTVPRRGVPRPIRLGVKKDGTISPLDLQ